MTGTEWFIDEMRQHLGRDVGQHDLKVALAVARALDAQSPGPYEGEYGDGFDHAVSMIEDYCAPAA